MTSTRMLQLGRIAAGMALSILGWASTPALVAQQAEPAAPQSVPAAEASVTRDTTGEGYVHRPGLTITLRGGLFQPRANDELFGVMTDLLTLSASDFMTTGFGGEFAAWWGDRTEFTLAIDAGRTTNPSEFRSTAESSSPVRQTTEFYTENLSIGARLYLKPKGTWDAIRGWQPRRWNIFAGLGGGQLRYKLEQSGNFIDYADGTVFPATFISSGGTPFAYVATGTAVQLTTRTAIVAEAKYQWGKAPLSPNQFHPNLRQFNLSGVRLTLGASYQIY